MPASAAWPRVVADDWDLPLRHLEQAVFARLAGDGAEDDVALVAVRSVGSCRELFCDALSAGRDNQGQARQRLRAWLESAGIPSQDRDAVMVAVGEAVSNAIDQGRDGDRAQMVTVELARRGSKLVASIGDRGRWRHGREALLSARGRGHLIMEALSDEVVIDLDHAGTVVTLGFGGPATYQPSHLPAHGETAVREAPG